MSPGRPRGAFPGWLARRGYGPRLKLRLVAKLRAASAPLAEDPPPASAWAIPVNLGTNVVPLRRDGPLLSGRF